MSHRPLILINLIIIPPLIRLIPEEMNSRILDPADFFFFCQVLQAVGLVPAGGEDVEGDLAADGETVGGEGVVSGGRWIVGKDMGKGGNGGEGRRGVTYVRPKWANFSRRASTNLARIWCSLSYFSKS